MKRAKWETFEELREMFIDLSNDNQKTIYCGLMDVNMVAEARKYMIETLKVILKGGE